MTKHDLELEIASTLGELAKRLIDAGLRIASAESCTGGWIAKSVTDIDGSSQWFDSAIVTYSNDAKVNLLGVSQQTLDTHGAVSQPIVKEMVLGLLDRCSANIGVSVSGVAGPAGGSSDKPVGTVWIAWANAGVFIEAVRYQFKGDREQVRMQAVDAALQGVLRILQQRNDD